MFSFLCLHPFTKVSFICNWLCAQAFILITSDQYRPEKFFCKRLFWFAYFIKTIQNLHPTRLNWDCRFLQDYDFKPCDLYLILLTFTRSSLSLFLYIYEKFKKFVNIFGSLYIWYRITFLSQKIFSKPLGIIFRWIKCPIAKYNNGTICLKGFISAYAPTSIINTFKVHDFANFWKLFLKNWKQ